MCSFLWGLRREAEEVQVKRAGVEGTESHAGRQGAEARLRPWKRHSRMSLSLWHSGPLPPAASIPAPEHALFPLTLPPSRLYFPPAFEKPEALLPRGHRAGKL